MVLAVATDWMGILSQSINPHTPAPQLPGIIGIHCRAVQGPHSSIIPAPVVLRNEWLICKLSPPAQSLLCRCRIEMRVNRSGFVTQMFCAACYRYLTMLLRQRKWLKNMNRWLLTFLSGLNKQSSSWTIANLPTHWLVCNSSFRHSIRTAQWRNHPSKRNHSAFVFY